MKNNNVIPILDTKEFKKNDIGSLVSKSNSLGNSLVELPNSQPYLLFTIENDLLSIDYTNEAFEKLIGYSSKNRAETAKSVIARFILINDFRIIKQKIIPSVLQHLKTTPAFQHPDLCFSFNYRTASNDANGKNILQHNFIYQSDVLKNTFMGIGYITDITHFKEDNKIIFTLEKNKTTSKGVNQELSFRNTYLPDDCAKLLTKREIEILNDIYNGFSSKEIANKLCLSLNTINNHRKNIIAKTNCKNSSDLIHYALKNGLL
jgi:DNA-binding CsgD family transcriptional regulator